MPQDSSTSSTLIRRAIAGAFIALTVMVALLSGAPAKASYEPVLSVGREGALQGQFTEPRGLAFDEAGNALVADTFNDRVQRFAPDWNSISQVGSAGVGVGQLFSPTDVAVGVGGAIYVAESGNQRIQKFSADGTPERIKGFYGSGEGQFIQGPVGIATDRDGNVYAADFGNHRIQKFDADLRYLGQWGTEGSGQGQFRAPRDIEVDAAGNVYVADTGNDRIQKFTSNGAFIAEWGSEGNGAGQLDIPSALAIHEDLGQLFIADSGNHRIQVFSNTGLYQGQFGAPDELSMPLQNPRGIAVSTDGQVIVSDTSRHRLRVYAGTAPTIQLTQHPGEVTDLARPRFQVVADLEGSRFECSLVRSGSPDDFGPCTNEQGGYRPQTDLSDGQYVFKARAFSVGLPSEVIVHNFRFRDPNPADATVSMGDPALVYGADGTLRFRFSADQSPVVYSCSLTLADEPERFTICGGAVIGEHLVPDARSLPAGGYVFRVRAIGRSGNQGPPASFLFVHDPATSFPDPDPDPVPDPDPTPDPDPDPTPDPDPDPTPDPDPDPDPDPVPDPDPTPDPDPDPTPGETCAKPALKLLGIKKLGKKGQARVRFKVSGPGTVRVTGKGLVPSSRKHRGSGAGSIRIIGKPKTVRKLNRRGKVKVRAKVVYRSPGCAPVRRIRNLTLIKR